MDDCRLRLHHFLLPTLPLLRTLPLLPLLQPHWCRSHAPRIQKPQVQRIPADDMNAVMELQTTHGHQLPSVQILATPDDVPQAP